ncbi:Hypothetical protein PHPALM_8081, partial [Phytophthora palmivora]
MKKRNGNYHSFSNYAGHRSAFHNLFQDYRKVMSVELEREISCHFKGLQRKVAAAISQGRGQIKIGKDPMPISLLKQVAMAMLQSSSRDMVFARTFMIMSWNLMARAANTVSICYKHLEWREDALCVYFAHMKNDQRGTRPRDPRHVYANPMAPEICPILALGVYWAVYAVDDEDVHLFPGNDEYERFRKVLGRVLKGPQVAAELERRGTIADDIGTHSMRKGASTFCSSGSTACPPSVAVHLRAGWSIVVGHRITNDTAESRSIRGSAELWEELYRRNRGWSGYGPRREASTSSPGPFGDPSRLRLPEQVEFVAEFALASLIYHIDFLREQLPTDHPLFQSPFFANAELILELQSRVRTTPSESNMQPTGVPPHVTILSE